MAPRYASDLITVRFCCNVLQTSGVIPRSLSACSECGMQMPCASVEYFPVSCMDPVRQSIQQGSTCDPLPSVSLFTFSSIKTTFRGSFRRYIACSNV